MRYKNGNTSYASYSTFYIGGSTTNYTLHVSGYSGTARDYLTYHNLMKFTTKDNDNDQWSGNCAIYSTGAWWYKRCYTSNLNGHYGDDLYWYSTPQRFVEMKLRHV